MSTHLKAAELVKRKAYLNPIFEKFAVCLRSMWGNYGKWAGLEVFDPLKDIAHDLLKVGGVDIQNRPQGPYVNVPL